MHELTIANSIVAHVKKEVERQDLPPVKAIIVRVGVLSDVVPEALEFNFDVIKADTPFSQTKLVIETVPLKGKCQKCDHEFSVENYAFFCPICNSGQITVTQGEELDIAYLEVEEGLSDGN